MQRAEQKSELTVVIKAKDLCAYFMDVTQKSPKQFRFSYVGRMQDLSLDIVEQIRQKGGVFLRILTLFRQNRAKRRNRVRIRQKGRCFSADIDSIPSKPGKKTE
jgi:hypothetical protein